MSNTQGLFTSYRYAVFTCLITSKRKNDDFLWFFWFFLVFVVFSQKIDDCFRFTTLKYAHRLLFSWFYATMVFSYCTNLPMISADRIERPKNRTECDFGVLSDPHLLWDGWYNNWTSWLHKIMKITAWVHISMLWNEKKTSFFWGKMTKTRKNQKNHQKSSFLHFESN